MMEQEQNSDARLFGMLCHLTAIFVGFVGPLIVWLIKREEFPFVDDQGKESLNFQLTVLIAAIVSGILIVAVIGIVLLPVVLIGAFVLEIVATIQANTGTRYRYPLNIRFIK